MIPFSLGSLISRVDHFFAQSYLSRTSFICKCSDFSYIVIKAKRIPAQRVRHAFFKYWFITKFPNSSLNGGVAAAVSVVRTDVMLDANDKITLVLPCYEDVGKWR